MSCIFESPVQSINTHNTFRVLEKFCHKFPQAVFFTLFSKGSFVHIVFEKWVFHLLKEYRKLLLVWIRVIAENSEIESFSHTAQRNKRLKKKPLESVGNVTNALKWESLKIFFTHHAKIISCSSLHFMVALRLIPWSYLSLTNWLHWSPITVCKIWRLKSPCQISSNFDYEASYCS